MFVWIEKGGLVMIPLLACSVIAVAIIFERMWFWLRIWQSRSPRQVDRILDLIEQGAYDQALSQSAQSRDYIVRIFNEGLKHHHSSLEGALGMAAGQELKRMHQYMSVLDTIITLAPLLGILGTVIGIITSFDILGAAGIDDPHAVTGGIAQALVTTAVGLSVAIVTIIPYNYFQSKITGISNEFEWHLTNFEIVYRKGFRHE